MLLSLQGICSENSCRGAVIAPARHFHPWL
jgi:hypothetical protein